MSTEWLFSSYLRGGDGTRGEGAERRGQRRGDTEEGGG